MVSTILETHTLFSQKKEKKKETHIKACYYIEYIVMKKKMNVITTSHVHDDSIKKLIKLKLVKRQIT